MSQARHDSVANIEAKVITMMCHSCSAQFIHDGTICRESKLAHLHASSCEHVVGTMFWLVPHSVRFKHESGVQYEKWLLKSNSYWRCQLENLPMPSTFEEAQCHNTCITTTFHILQLNTPFHIQLTVCLLLTMFQ